MSVKEWIVIRLLAGLIKREGPKMFKKLLGANWKTSLGGWVTIIATLVAIAKCFTCSVDCMPISECLVTALAGFGIGGGLIAAKDANVTGGTVPNS